MSRHTVLSAILAIPALALSACGGGGGVRAIAGPPASAPVPRVEAPAPAPEPAPTPHRRPVSAPGGAPLQLSPVEVQTAAPEMTAVAAIRAAHSRPRFGSVTQSSNRDAHSVTTDTASASFTGGKLAVQVRRQGKPALSFDSANATHDSRLRTGDARNWREWGFVSATAARSSTAFARVEYDVGDDTDWIAGGSWLAIEGDARGGAIRSVEVGAFVDGPEYGGGAPILPTGDMSLSGDVRGTYSIEHGNGDRSIAPGSIEIGEVVGYINLTASMADMTIGGRVDLGYSWGTLWDKATGVRREGRGFSGEIPIRFDLGSTIYSAGGVFTGAVSVPSSVRSSGAWGGKFSNVAGSGSDPRGAAGTVGVDFRQADGTRGSLVAYWDASIGAGSPLPPSPAPELVGPGMLPLPSGAASAFTSPTTTITIPAASTTADSEGNRYKTHGNLRFICVGTGECVVTVTRDNGGAVTATFTGPAARVSLETEAAAVDTHHGVVSALETIVGNADASFSWSGSGARTHTAGDLALRHMHGIAARYSTMPARNGVSLASETILAATNHRGDRTDHYRIAGWMEHSMFHQYTRHTIYAPPDNPLHQTQQSPSATSSSYSIGSATGANPTGAFTWSGVAFGVDVDSNSSTFGNAFIGNVTLDIDDISNPDLDISIANLTRLGGAETLPNFAWSDLTMTDGGFSIGSSSNKRIQGQFYGPNAEEVGGVFTWHPHAFPAQPTVNGVFGAKRP